MVRRLSQTKIRKKNKKLTVARKNKSSRKLSKKRSNKGRKQKGGRKTRRRPFKKTISQIGGAGNLSPQQSDILRYEKSLKAQKANYYKFAIYDSNGNKYYIFLPNEAGIKAQNTLVIKLSGSFTEQDTTFTTIYSTATESKFERSDLIDEIEIKKAIYLNQVNTIYQDYIYDSENLQIFLHFLADFLGFISKNRSKNKNKYPITFNIKFCQANDNAEPVPWCTDLISLMARALKEPIKEPRQLELLKKRQQQEPQPQSQSKDKFPFDIGNSFVNYEFIHRDRTRCVLHITKDKVRSVVTDILKTLKEKGQGSVENPDSGYVEPLAPALPPPRPQRPNSPPKQGSPKLPVKPSSTLGAEPHAYTELIDNTGTDDIRF